jgi:hypothetical protein
MNNSATQQRTASPSGTAKHSHHSPEDAQDWSGEERSSDEEANDRSQSGTSNKRKRPLSVSCETCSKFEHKSLSKSKDTDSNKNSAKLNATEELRLAPGA